MALDLNNLSQDEIAFIRKYFVDASVGSIARVKEEPITDEKLLALARENERLRRAGTHVYHPATGVIELEEAETFIRQTIDERRKRPTKEVVDAIRAEFKGHPETGVVEAWSGRVVEIASAPSSSPPPAK